MLRDPAYREEKLIIFTEHRDTQTYLVRRLEQLGYQGEIAQIHGGMPYPEREVQVDFFHKPVADGGARYLIATDAAGEGINLQFCWIMVNYDVPWNRHAWNSAWGASTGMGRPITGDHHQPGGGQDARGPGVEDPPGEARGDQP